MSNLAEITCFLFDNGSKRPESTSSLRRIANRLARQLGCKTEAVSLLHSNAVPATELDGQQARLLEESLEAFGAAGGKIAVVLPLFFGPSGALTEYLPPRLKVLATKHPHTRFILGKHLESPDDDSAELLARAIHREISSTITAAQFSLPTVVLTDHGSPLAEVTQVRNRVGEALKKPLAETMVASMERRDGDEYAFNEPLLETALEKSVKNGEAEIVVALQFLFAGRHAGREGDIAQICAAVGEKYPDLKTVTTEPIGESPEILQLLVRRFFEAAN